MRHVLLSVSFLLGTALVPTYAEELNQTTLRQQPSIHAPTNRVGAAVPTMKSGEEASQTESKTIVPSEEQGNAAASAQQNEQQGIHPPTNRIGAALPTMKQPDDRQPRSLE